jgi:hypothetical protein
VKRFAAALPKDAEMPEVRAATSARIINDLDATPLSLSSEEAETKCESQHLTRKGM